MNTFFNNGKMLFATSYREDEITCLKAVKPPHILASFAMWRNDKEDKHLQHNLLDRIGYRPETLYIDCGSFTFKDTDYGLWEMINTYQEMREEDGFTFNIHDDQDLVMFSHWWFSQFDEDAYVEDKSQFNLFEQYLNFLWMNRGLYDYCFAFDRLGDNQESLLAFRIMDALGLPVIPVYQATYFQVNKEGQQQLVPNTLDYDILDYYAAKCDYIAIGGTAASKVKGFTKNIRIEIVNNILSKYQDKSFHLLGTLDPYIINACPNLYSVDGQAWLQKVEKEKKISASIKYLNNKLAWFESKRNQDIYANNQGQLQFII
ncbi:hypothetical protein [Bacillus sp. FJAT-29937]|uniref:hypothetical protein n=1 Tax=Bacillus sp. FJAT-29937 TaxID=1720553 RepID=UPI000835A10F|nr:hypothetical protein [Bacillus sp. FJAT-29937]